MSIRTDRARKGARAAHVSKLIRSAVLAAAATVTLTGSASAATLYWDIDGATPGGSGTTTATGTWGTNDFWSTDSGGGAATTAWDVDASGDDIAVFSAGTDVTAATTVTVSGTQTTAGITFEESNITLTGGGLTLSGASPTLTVGTGTATRTIRINSAISAANAVHITRGSTGNANLNLGAANTFTGGIAIDGRVRINVNADGALGGGGTITVNASGAGIATENAASAAAAVTVANNIVMAPGVTSFSIGAGKPDGSINFSGNISGDGALLWEADPFSTNSNGNGLLIVSGTNTYTGTTYVNHSPTTGVVRLGSAGALPTNTRLFFGHEKGGTVENGGDVDLAGQDIQISSLESNLPAPPATIHGITNSNASAGGNITITGGVTSTFNRQIGTLPTLNNNPNNLPVKTNNLALTLASSHTGNLTLSMVNDYAGPTTINGGTLTVANAGNTVAGPVIVNSGGTLASSAGSQATIRGVGGLITVNDAGVVSPGGEAGVGVIAANGGMTVNTGGNLDFTLTSLTAYDQINVNGGALTLDSGAHPVDILGAAAPGTYTLMNYGSLVSDDTNLFTLGSTPGGAFNYNLATGANALTLTITPTVQTLAWDVGGGGPPIVEGAGTWVDGSTDFTDLSTNTGAAFSNAGTADIVFGNDAAAFGGLISLGGNIRTGGMLTFGTIAPGATYTIGDPGTTNTLTTVGGIVANGSVTTTINAPVVLETSQTWNVTTGSGLVINGGIADGAGGPTTLTKSGAGTLTLMSLSTFSGGLAITAGRVDASSDAAIGTGDVTLENRAQFRFIAPFSTDNNFVVAATGGQIYTDAANPGAITSSITGAGRLEKEGGGRIDLLGTNTFSSLLVGNGSIYVNSDAALGLGDVTLDSGGLGAISQSWSTAKNIIFTGDNFNEDFRTNGFNISVSGAISGPGDLHKYDAGTLILSGNNGLYTGNTIVPASGGGGTIRTESINALGTGNLQIRAAATLDVATQLNLGAIRGDAELIKTGTGLLNLSGTTTNGNLNGSIVVNEGAVQLNNRDSLGGIAPATGAATTFQLAITLNSGTELRSNWGSGTPRRGTSITLNNATIRRLDTAPGENIYSTYNGDVYYGGVLTIIGNSTISNEQISNGTGVNNLGFDMPVLLQAGATLTMHNANDAGDWDAYNTSLRGVNTTVHSAYDILTMNDGSSIVTTGPGEKRIGGITTGKPIVVNGNATLKLDRRTFMTDIDGSGTGNEFTKVTINGGGGLRIEAPMNASYSTPIDPQPVQQPEDGFTGFFGVNTTSTAEGGTPPAAYDVIGNAYTVFSPKRANGLAGSNGTITLAATDATDATGRIEHGPSAPADVRIALDNTPASAGAALVYEIDAAANGGTFNNFAGLDVKRTNAGAGSLRAKLVNSIVHVDSISIGDDAAIDVNDQKLIVDNQPAGNFNGTAYTGIQGEVQRAYNFGAWDQPGLMTSQPNAGFNAGPLSGTTTIGVATAEQVMFIGPSDTGVFQGRTVTGSSVIAMYTYAGDLNFDGLVDGADYGVIDNYVQFPGTDGYVNGDFNYDGIIDGADYGVIDNTIQLQGDPFPGVVFGANSASSSGLSGVTAVPEPSACGFAILGGAALLGRRRRRQR